MIYPRPAAMSWRAFSSSILLVLLSAAAVCSDSKYEIGVNYGQLGNNLPPPKVAVDWIKRLGIGHVKIYDANPAILAALANTDITVAVMVTDAEVPAVGASQQAADAWVEHNVSAYYPATRIRTILVGNELLSDPNQKETWPLIVPAIRKLRKALEGCKLHHRIKVSTPLAMDMLNGSIFPPSNATFRDDIREPIMRPLLQYLHDTRSSLFVDAYPYFAWENDAKNIELEFALFGKGTRGYTDPASGLHYSNLLDVQLDAVSGAMGNLLADQEYDEREVQLTLSETGWPTRQDLDERGAYVRNAALYNRRLVRKMLAKPAIGTPRRPGTLIRSYIFALFNENEKTGATTERNFGLLYPNGTRVYEVDLRGRLPDSAYGALPPAPSEPPVGSLKLWCVANPSATSASLAGGLEYACAQSTSVCAGIQKAGQPCFKPDTLLAHASYAFNNYYRLFKALGGSCSFNGAANLTLHDPSYGSCIYEPLVF